MLGSRAKRNRITKYLENFSEEYEVLEDNLVADNPAIKLQTNTRVITLQCNDNGKVEESFRMRRGAGSKEEFLAKQEAYNAVRSYYDDYYTGAKIKQSSFDEGYIKLELETKIVTLTYNSKAKAVEEKERARRGTKQILVKDKGNALSEIDAKTTGPQTKPRRRRHTKAEMQRIEDKTKLTPEQLIVSEPDSKFVESLSVPTTHHARVKSLEEKPKRHRRTKAEIQAAREVELKVKVKDDYDPNQFTLDQFYDKEFIRGTHDDEAEIKADTKERIYDKIPEGAIIRNRYSNKVYKVVKPALGNIVEVFDESYGYLTMARADVEVKVNIPEF